MKKTFDAVAFMRKRREELSGDYAGPGWQQIEERMQQVLRDDPLWRKRAQRHKPVPSKVKMGGCGAVEKPRNLRVPATNTRICRTRTHDAAHPICGRLAFSTTLLSLVFHAVLAERRSAVIELAESNTNSVRLCEDTRLFPCVKQNPCRTGSGVL